MYFGGVTGASTWISYIVVDANQLGATYQKIFHLCTEFTSLQAEQDCQ